MQAGKVHLLSTGTVDISVSVISSPLSLFVCVSLSLSLSVSLSPSLPPSLPRSLARSLARSLSLSLSLCLSLSLSLRFCLSRNPESLNQNLDLTPATPSVNQVRFCRLSPSILTISSQRSRPPCCILEVSYDTPKCLYARPTS